jgi:hypothetical protein
MPEFPHAHPSQLVCIPGERADALDNLRAELAAEHRPATTTEELLVDEMAQHYWRMKRYRYLEASMWMAEERAADGKLTANLEVVQWTISSGIAAHYHRCLVAAERAFYKALNSLRGMQKERGFVFTDSSEQTTAAPEPVRKLAESTRTAAASAEVGFVFAESSKTPSGFVPAKSPEASVGFVPATPQRSAEHQSGFVPAKAGKLHAQGGEPEAA